MLRGLFITDIIDFPFTLLPCRNKTEQSFLLEASQPPDVLFLDIWRRMCILRLMHTAEQGTSRTQLSLAVQFNGQAQDHNQKWTEDNLLINFIEETTKYRGCTDAVVSLSVHQSIQLL